MKQVSRMKHINKVGESFYVCVLCSTGEMHTKVIQSHLNGCPHKTRLACQAEEKRRGEEKRRKAEIRRHQVAALQPRVETLGFTRWKEEIGKVLAAYLLADHGEDGITNPGSLEYVERTLGKYEKMERVSLLELAVWKAGCLRFDETRNFQSMQDTLDLWAMDETFDPVEYKRQCRFASSVAVVIRGILPFLG